MIPEKLLIFFKRIEIIKPPQLWPRRNKCWPHFVRHVLSLQNLLFSFLPPQRHQLDGSALHREGNGQGVCGQDHRPGGGRNRRLEPHARSDPAGDPDPAPGHGPQVHQWVVSLNFYLILISFLLVSDAMPSIWESTRCEIASPVSVSCRRIS